MKLFFGRKKEISLFENHLKNYSTALVKIDGRRRVGKTFYAKEIITRLKNKENDKVVEFNFIGNKNFSLDENVETAFNWFRQQLEFHSVSSDEQIAKSTSDLLNFLKNNGLGLLNYSKREKKWDAFFNLLKVSLSRLTDQGFKVVVFFDEVAWFDSHSKFINTLANYWNSHFANQNNTVFLLASSVTYWLNEKVSKNTNVFFQRTTLNITLTPFKLDEIYEYATLQQKKVLADGNEKEQFKNDLIRYYSIFGGIIKYYELIDFNLTYDENILNIQSVFSEIFKEEENQIQGLFESNYDCIKEILNVLCRKKKAYLDEIFNEVKTKYKVSEITLRKILTHLVSSHLVIESEQETTVQNKIYMIGDLFTYFVYFWGQKKNIKAFHLYGQEYSTWKGSAFEILLLLNQHLIKPALFKHHESVSTQYYLNWLTKQENTDNRKIKTGKIKSQIDILLKANFAKQVTPVDFVKVIECKMSDDLNGYYLNEIVFDELVEKVEKTLHHFEKERLSVPVKKQRNIKIEAVVITNNKMTIAKKVKEKSTSHPLISFNFLCLKDLF